MKLESHYDDLADVLYLTLGPAVKAATEESNAAPGVLLRFADSNGEPCAVTVLDYVYYWIPQVDRLTEVIAQHLRIPADKVREHLEETPWTTP